MNSTGATSSTRCQFTRREFVNFTGLHFSRARWYDPNLGQFIREDPIGFDGGDVNLYGYLKNQPLSSVDPPGMGSWDWKDFVYHYYFGAGRAVDLGDIGLLSTFRSSSSVISEVTQFKAKFIALVNLRSAKECEKNCIIRRDNRQSCFSTSDVTSTGVTSEPGLFAVGRRKFNRSAACFADVDCRMRSARFTCNLGFSIHDRFTDPLDGERIGKPLNLPAAQRHGINARWMEEFSGQFQF